MIGIQALNVLSSSFEGMPGERLTWADNSVSSSFFNAFVVTSCFQLQHVFRKLLVKITAGGNFREMKRNSKWYNVRKIHLFVFRRDYTFPWIFNQKKVWNMRKRLFAVCCLFRKILRKTQRSVFLIQVYEKLGITWPEIFSFGENLRKNLVSNWERERLGFRSIARSRFISVCFLAKLS